MADITKRIVTVILLCGIFCFSWSLQDKMHVVVPLPAVVGLRQQAEICSKETGVPADNLKRIIYGPPPEGNAFKQFFYCVCHNSGYMDKQGHFVVEKMMSLKLMNGTDVSAAEMYKECNKITLENEVETSFAVGACGQEYFLYTVQTN